MVLKEKMEKLISKLYVSVLQEATQEDDISRLMKQEILELLKEEKKILERQEYEKYREKAFQAASVAEEHGFERGFKYAFHLFTECMQR